jgi:ABC-type uncharacterized transport system involved in gliding motility auxiliary subunit
MMAFIKQCSLAVKLGALLVIGLVGLWSTSAMLGNQRIDLTADKLFTLSDGTRTMLAQLEQPVELWWFNSERMLRDAPSLRNYALRVENLLGEMTRHADGKLRLRSVDPAPFSVDEDRAAQWGLQAVPVEAGQPALYLGLAAVGDNGSEEVIPFLHPNRQHFLEYDIARTIARAARLRPPTIGLISSLPVNGGLDLARRTVHRPWTALRELSASYAIEDLGVEATDIPDEIDVLLLIQPGSLSPATLFAIDQFVLAGQPALIFVDPDAQSAGPPVASDFQRQGEGRGEEVRAGERTALQELFRSWGVHWAGDKVVGDAAHAMLVNIGDDQAPVRDLTLLGMGSDHIAAGAAITQGLETLNLATSGAWQALPDATSRWQPLLWSSRGSALIDSRRVQGLENPGDLLADFVPDGQEHAMIGLLTGPVNSTYAAAQAQEGQRGEHRQGDIKVLLVGDTDLLTDRLWVQVQGFMGQPVLAPFADNGSLLVNAADYLTGSGELIGVRGRGTLERPFTRMHELQREAEVRYRDEADALTQQLQETEQRLAQLQAQTAATGAARMGVEQQAMATKYIDRKLQLREAQREVQQHLSADIDKLGRQLKLINIALVPALLTLVLLAQYGYRRLRSVAY